MLLNLQNVQRTGDYMTHARVRLMGSFRLEPE